MSLYRKYRPQTFEDVVGQEHIAQTLRNALGATPLRVSHAYLFCGPRGTGKTTAARLLAKCLNCENGPTPIPCNKCDFCTGVRDNQQVMDLTEIDAASHTGVDNVREVIIDKVDIRPAVGNYRIYIIDEVHMLSTSSFNALLKTLEEPPPHAIFILATTDAHKVPVTISSRCQRFDFRRVGPNDIASRLQYVAKCENIQLEDAAARLIATTADGALRDALTLLEQVTAFSAETIAESDVRLVLGTVSRELLWQLMESVSTRDASRALTCIESATEEGVSFQQLTRDLIAYARDALLLTVGFQSATADDIDNAPRAAHAKAMGRARLLACVEGLRAAEKEMRGSTDHRLLLELALVRAASENTPEIAVASTSVVAAPRLRAVEIPKTEIARVEVPKTEIVAPQELAEQNGASNEVVTPEIALQNGATAHLQVLADAEEGIEAVAPQIEAPTENVEIIEPEAITEPEEVAIETVAKPTANGRKGRRIHNLQEFQELWPKVLVRVKNKIGITAVAYLHDAIPIEFTEKDAVLEFRKEFHYEKACEAAKRLPFEQVLNECLASPHILRFRMAAPKPKAAPKAEPEPEPVAYEDEEEDILKMAQDMFAAQVVGRSGQG